MEASFPTLTTGVDQGTSFEGTSKDDTFVASVGATGPNASDTLNATDSIKGGAGTDTLNLTVTAANTAALQGALISEIENISVRAGAASVIDASTAVGATQIIADRGTGTLLVNNLATGAAITVNGNGTAVQGEVAFAPVTAASAITLNFTNGVAQTAGADAVTAAATIAAGNATGTATTATITSSGAANVTGTVDLANATLTTVTVNAATNLKGDFLSQATNQVGTDGSVTISGAAASVEFTAALDDTIKTINASGLTAGGLTATLGILNTQTVTGGAGNDVITTSGTVLTTGSVNAGAGTDTLVLGANVADAATTTLAAKFTNFEIVRVNGTHDASLIAGITGVQVTGASTVSKLTAAQALNLNVFSGSAGTGDAQSFALTTATGTSDVATITLGNGLTTSEAGDINGLTVTGFERVNLVATPGATAVAANKTSTIASFTGATLNNVTLTGTAFDLQNIATTVAVTIDGSALTGDGATTSLGLTVGGSAVAGSTITGSAVVDTFVIGAEGSTYNAGAGNDSFSTTAAILAADGTTDLVLAGGAGTDTLTITGALTLTDNNLTNVTGMEKLASAATTAVSYTGFGAAAKTAFADGMTVTTGTLADGATYTFGSGLYDKAVTLTLASSGDGATTADNIAIATGSAADTISVTAASWVGHATTGGTLVVGAGAGNDTISVTIAGAAVLATGIATITGGLGADVITSVGINATNASNQVYTIAAGDSTVSAYDSITGFDAGNGTNFSSTLDFASVGLTAYAATAVTGNTAAELTAAVSAAGLVTFAGTKAAALTLAEKIAAVQGVVTTNAGDSALFTHGTNAYVFNNNATADSVVELIGLSTATSLITANATTANAIFIA